MSDSDHRLEQLTDVVVDVVRESGDRIPSERYMRLIRRLNVQKPEEFKSKFVENLMVSVRKDLVADLSHNNRHLPELLDEVDDAETRAYARRDRHRNGERLKPEDMPAKIYALNSKDLVNCQLRVARAQWLQELKERRKAVDEQLIALTQERDRRRAELVDKFQHVGVRITALSNIYKDMKGTDVSFLDHNSSDLKESLVVDADTPSVQHAEDTERARNVPKTETDENKRTPHAHLRAQETDEREEHPNKRHQPS